MITLSMIAIAIAAGIVLRMSMSQPPRGGVSKSVQGRPESPALPAPSAPVLGEALAGAPPAVPIAPQLARTAPLPSPQVSLAVLGVEHDRDADDKELWRLAREHLNAKR